MSHSRSFGSFVVLCLISASALAGEYVSLRAGTVSGDFGSDVKSTLNNLVLTVGTQREDFDASISGQLSQLDVDGQTESGIGDLYVHGGTRLREEMESGFDLYTSVAAKIPTADENKGLGTGEPDYNLYLSAAKSMGGIKWNLHGGYTFIGDPGGINYDNQFLYGIGLFKGFQTTGLFASVESGNAALETGGDDSILELHFGAMHWATMNNLLGLSGFLGFTDASADYGFDAEWVWFK
jgi:hypothetical protein